jgi:hypothetical protein
MFPQPVDGVLEGNYDQNPDWPQYVNIELARWMILELGDPETGPAITNLTKIPGSIPGLTDDMIGDRAQLSHFHRSDVFRMAIGEHEDQVNHAGNHVGANGFFVMRASKRYNESLGLGDVRFMDIYADRRGIPATMVRDASHPAYDPESLNMIGQLFTVPPQFHQTDETVVTGVATSFAEIPGGGRMFSSMSDHTGWTSLSDGSSVAVAAIGDPTAGPVVILTQTPAGVVEPSATWGADIYRLVVGGSVTVGDTKLGQRQFRAIEAGLDEGELVHGPDGSEQILVVADRRHWRPVSGGSDSRQDEIAAVVDKALGALVSA